MSSTDPSAWKGRIVIAGTGGQGVLTTAKVLCDFFAARGASVVSGQVHGMSQRGGAVQSFVMVNSGLSPVLRPGSADFALGLEPVECARTVPLIGPSTRVYMNVTPVVPFVVSQASIRGGGEAHYPELHTLTGAIRAITPHLTTVDASSIAREIGDARMINTTLLGCLFGSAHLPWAPEEFAQNLRDVIPSPLLERNLEAYGKGVGLARSVGSPEF